MSYIMQHVQVMWPTCDTHAMMTLHVQNDIISYNYYNNVCIATKYGHLPIAKQFEIEYM